MDHIFTIEEIVAFIGEPNGISEVDTARSLAVAIQPVLDERLKLDRPRGYMTQDEWNRIIPATLGGWLIADAVEALIKSISRFELLARIASRS